ncbi:TonB-dependent receptor [Psychroserpens sp.]|uniref:TonB-dependent receptor n=1 Tax=Psychroserpens sp. TaxID=2020870 RepID=UPI001B285E3A|nr:TonB-dependent receptor [Psychroserpens sp.]MBO6606837.1 TonB-dependent receptor [Psychroserpens sp.]MBO6653540.1 TonB-dependent receptor [Psychroserpens sp.]MBO6680432.1 TonB-dependent receptor [Psychroserpens sp.]MBO6750609.1 TonB-dependent receptor [Psychroserpens sp.]MBO6915092.1 TonB-dependent receptor [Psychroserpens sp.]
MMKLKYKALLLFVLSINFLLSQEKVTLSGTITDAGSNETLIGVNIIFPELQTGTNTNEYGFYSISLPKGTYKVQISYLGYTTITETLTFSENQVINYKLEESTESLDEIVIKQDVEKLNIKKPQMSVNALSINTIKQMPVVLGEVDVIKSITLLPGVTNAGEGSSGFNVRGGAVDQNLILLDEATIFNSSHLFGFFSVFNPDAIKDIKLYKGGIPAKYGGRVSSVLDIYQKDGNSNEFHMNGGIGFVSSRLLAEGPIKKGKGSFLFGGRSSYAHLFLPLFDVDNTAYFYDLNTKLSYRLNDKNSIFLSGYFGRDVFNISDSFENTYGNTVINFRWNHLFSDRLFSNMSLIYSDYYYGLNLNFVEFEWDSGIQNFNFKYDLKHYINNKFKLEYGLNSIYYKFNPGEINPSTSTSGINPFKLIDKYAFENAIYLDAEHQITDKLALSYGLRVSSFLRLGQDELNTYTDDNPVLYNETLQLYEKANPTGTESFSRIDVIESFANLEPRFSLAYQLNDQSSVKASYNRMTQYLHLLSNTSSPTPLDVWTPSGKFIEPQILDQVAIGYFRTFKDNTYALEFESFYKTIQNRIDYIDGADLIANNAIEQVILNGEARAYGMEVLLRKNEGRLKGWLAYTLSKSEQQTLGRTPLEPGINNGEWYSTPYDKTHDISLTASYELNDRWTFGSNFLFQTGLPVTFPNGQYQFNGIVVPTYEARNSSRLPAYHRLDISATYNPKKNANRRWQGQWVFGIYNIYNRRNAASIQFAENRETGRNEATRLAIFGIVPSVSYNFKF